MLEVSIEKSMGKFKLQSSFKVQKGVLGILGSSGCGKSMTLKCLSGLYNPDSGYINLNGNTLFSDNQKINVQPHKRNIGYVFQNYALFPHLTVIQNIAYGIKDYEHNLRDKMVSEMISRMELLGLENNYPSQLSGGQQQRTALARTLIKRPNLLLLDEPFSAIDSHIKSLLEKELITIIKNNFNGIVLLVTHNVEECYRLCDQIMIMDSGQKIQFGTKEEIIQSPSSVTAARITGCKNFLDVTVLEENSEFLLLKSNDLIFKSAIVKQHCSKNMIACIRAHHLNLLPIETNVDNAFDCNILEITDSLFSTTLVLNCKSCILEIEVSKSSPAYELTQRSNNLKLHIPPEHVVLVEKNNN
ncbi:ATP-binding cassette domain-containing protein [Alkalibaculum sp. M08DMB]|uniref:ATP-binding cassette domain-containing protein n=1 Tax=Alkalibaculum sporogenes TaxID=2655001 RepID=A0A6A7K5B1_9FIRM|nr:ATP-binding cassette domain-containing protein [Alkalibaculum sporogenes]MPW24447.1 ATP-binding cassette domain-containing protein [Alkalibaculum sporogenes]